jgi:hypothetical protein
MKLKNKSSWTPHPNHRAASNVKKFTPVAAHTVQLQAGNGTKENQWHTFTNLLGRNETSFEEMFITFWSSSSNSTLGRLSCMVAKDQQKTYIEMTLKVSIIVKTE